MLKNVVMSMANKQNTVLMAHKQEPTTAFVYVLYERLLKEATSSNPLNRRLKFSQVSHIMGAIYRLPKKLHFPFLQQMEKLGLVEIKPFHFVILKVGES